MEYRALLYSPFSGTTTFQFEVAELEDPLIMAYIYMSEIMEPEWELVYTTPVVPRSTNAPIEGKEQVA